LTKAAFPLTSIPPLPCCEVAPASPPQSAALRVGLRVVTRKCLEMASGRRGVLVHSDYKTDHLDPIPLVNFKVKMKSMAMMVWNNYTRPIPVPSLLHFTSAQAPLQAAKCV
jgi:hypothetical protein